MFRNLSTLLFILNQIQFDVFDLNNLSLYKFRVWARCHLCNIEIFFFRINMLDELIICEKILDVYYFICSTNSSRDILPSLLESVWDTNSLASSSLPSMKYSLNIKLASCNSINPDPSRSKILNASSRRYSIPSFR